MWNEKKRSSTASSSLPKRYFITFSSWFIMTLIIILFNINITLTTNTISIVHASSDPYKKQRQRQRQRQPPSTSFDDDNTTDNNNLKDWKIHETTKNASQTPYANIFSLYPNGGIITPSSSSSSTVTSGILCLSVVPLRATFVNTDDDNDNGDNNHHEHDHGYNCHFIDDDGIMISSPLQNIPSFFSRDYLLETKLFLPRATFQNDEVVLLSDDRQRLIWDDSHDNNKDQQQRRRRSLAQNQTGIKTLLVIHITLNGISTSTSPSDISRYVFSTNSVSLASQYTSCSHSLLTFIPAQTNTPAHPGVLPLSLTIPPHEPKTYHRLSNLAKRHIILHHTNINLPSISHLLFALPPTATDNNQIPIRWEGLAGTPGRESWYANHRIKYNFITMHEVGHNLGLYHSGEGNNLYGDRTCLMGIVVKHKKEVRACFNAVKMWELGWYSSEGGMESVDDDDDSSSRRLLWDGRIISVNDYKKSQQQTAAAAADNRHVVVVLRINNKKNPRQSLYLSYNRAKGMTMDTGEYQNQILLFQRKPNGESLLVGHLSIGESASFDEFGAGGLTITVTEAGSSDDDDDVDYARVTVLLNGVSCESDDDCRKTTTTTTDEAMTTPATNNCDISERQQQQRCHADTKTCHQQQPQQPSSSFPLTPSAAAPSPCCGNTICDYNETCHSCPSDCRSSLHGATMDESSSGAIYGSIHVNNERKYYDTSVFKIQSKGERQLVVYGMEIFGIIPQLTEVETVNDVIVKMKEGSWMMTDNNESESHATTTTTTTTNDHKQWLTHGWNSTPLHSGPITSTYQDIDFVNDANEKISELHSYSLTFTNPLILEPHTIISLLVKLSLKKNGEKYITRDVGTTFDTLQRQNDDLLLYEGALCLLEALVCEPKRSLRLKTKIHYMYGMKYGSVRPSVSVSPTVGPSEMPTNVVRSLTSGVNGGVITRGTKFYTKAENNVQLLKFMLKTKKTLGRSLIRIFTRNGKPHSNNPNPWRYTYKTKRKGKGPLRLLDLGDLKCSIGIPSGHEMSFYIQAKNSIIYNSVYIPPASPPLELEVAVMRLIRTNNDLKMIVPDDYDRYFNGRVKYKIGTDVECRHRDQTTTLTSLIVDV